MPGMCTNSKIFENIEFDSGKYEINKLEWIAPLSIREGLHSYASRLAEQIKDEPSIFVGVSLGGVIMQEVSKIRNCKQLILISSVKDYEEKPLFMKIGKFVKFYYFIPPYIYKTLVKMWFKFTDRKYYKRKVFYKKYVTVIDLLYIKWATRSLLEWKGSWYKDNTVHIQADKDNVFPLENLKGNIKIIINGTHIMVISHFKKINKIIKETLD